MAEEWKNIIQAIFNDDLENLTSLVPSKIPFDSTIPLDVEPKFKFFLMNETHSLLTFASKSNATKCTTFLAKNCSDINYKSSSSLSAYLYAVLNNNVELVNFFIGYQGIDLNVTDKRGYYAIHIAASNGFDELLSIFLTQKIYDSNLFTISDTNSETPLIISIKTSHKNSFNMLLKNGAAADLPSSKSIYPLHAAVESNDQDILQSLLLNPIDVNCRDSEGFTPLLLSFKEGKTRMFEILLLSEKADINAITNNGDNIFFFSTSKPFTIDKRIFLISIQHPDLNLNYQNGEGDTVLHALVSYSKLFEIECLLKIIHRLDPNVYNNQQQTPLDIAISNKNIEIISSLLDCDKVELTEFGRKSHLFHLAAARNCQKLINPLINRGIDPDSDDGMGTTPLMMAIMKKNSMFVRKLIGTRKIDINKANKARQNPLLMASMLGDGSIIVRMLLCHPLLIVNCQNEIGETPLVNAIRYGNPGTVEALLENPNVDPNFIGKQRAFPFLEAVKSGNRRMIDAFLNNPKTNFCIHDDANSNAVHYAILSGDYDVLELVLQINGIDIKMKSDEYNTPLEMVLNIENIQFASLLVKKIENDLDKIDEKDLTPNEIEQRNICCAVNQLIEVYKSMNSSDSFF